MGETSNMRPEDKEISIGKYTMTVQEVLKYGKYMVITKHEKPNELDKLMDDYYVVWKKTQENKAANGYGLNKPEIIWKIDSICCTSDFCEEVMARKEYGAIGRPLPGCINRGVPRVANTDEVGFIVKYSVCKCEVFFFKHYSCTCHTCGKNEKCTCEKCK